jgi:glycerol-3-phosphate acyltransferase PlsY
VPALSYIVVVLVAYLLGSIPTGYLVARARGIDIRTVGSGNIGATNVLRMFGKRVGVFVLLADSLKGWTAVQVAAPLASQLIGGPPADYLRITAGIVAILGHNYTCWLYFKGGKGIATSAGVMVALVPWALLIILGIWLVIFLITRFVSLGSIGAAFALPFATWFTTGHDLGLTIVTAALSGLAIYKHRRNIRRLLDGTENRIRFKKREAA